MPGNRGDAGDTAATKAQVGAEVPSPLAVPIPPAGPVTVPGTRPAARERRLLPGTRPATRRAEPR